MARKKPTRKKPTRKNIDAAPGMMQAVQSYLSGSGSGRRNVSVEELIALAEQRLDSEDAKRAFEEHVAASRPGTVGAAKLVTAADAIEDEDLLLDLARRGFMEALRSHAIQRRINDDASDALEAVANIQAAERWSSPDDRYPDAWIVAEFGDALGVNGVLLNDDDKVPERPSDFVLTDHGGRVPTTEEIIDPRTIAKTVASSIGIPDGEQIIEEILRKKNPGGIAVSVGGETEVWMKEVADEEEFPVVTANTPRRGARRAR